MEQLRGYRLQDLAVVSALVMDFFNHHRKLKQRTDLMKELEAQRITQSWSQEHTLLVYESNGSVTGFVRLRRDGDTHWIEDIGVAESVQGRGHGGRMLALLEDYLLAKGQDSMYVFVLPENTVALDFYVRHGFTTINMIELRKDRNPMHRNEISATGKNFSLSWRASRE